MLYIDCSVPAKQNELQDTIYNIFFTDFKDKKFDQIKFDIEECFSNLFDNVEDIANDLIKKFSNDFDNNDDFMIYLPSMLEISNDCINNLYLFYIQLIKCSMKCDFKHIIVKINDANDKALRFIFCEDLDTKLFTKEIVVYILSCSSLMAINCSKLQKRICLCICDKLDMNLLNLEHESNVMLYDQGNAYFMLYMLPWKYKELKDITIAEIKNYIFISFINYFLFYNLSTNEIDFELKHSTVYRYLSDENLINIFKSSGQMEKIVFNECVKCNNLILYLRIVTNNGRLFLCDKIIELYYYLLYTIDYNYKILSINGYAVSSIIDIREYCHLAISKSENILLAIEDLLYLKKAQDYKNQEGRFEKELQEQKDKEFKEQKEKEFKEQKEKELKEKKELKEDKEQKEKDRNDFLKWFCGILVCVLCFMDYLFDDLNVDNNDTEISNANEEEYED